MVYDIRTCGVRMCDVRGCVMVRDVRMCVILRNIKMFGLVY